MRDATAPVSASTVGGASALTTQRLWLRESRLVRWLPPALEAGLAAALGFLLLDGKSFWLDEGFSVAVARLDSQHFWNVLLGAEKMRMLVYYVVLRGWLHLGESDFFIRSLSVIFSVATVLLVYGLTQRLFGRRTAIVAGLLMATSGFAVQYAQDARAYTLLAAASAGATYLFVIAVERRKLRFWLLYALVAGICLYIHYFFVLVVLAHFLSLPALGLRRVQWRYAFAAAVVIGGAGLRLALYGTEGFTWIPGLSVATVTNFFRQLAGGSYSLLFVMTIAIAVAVAYGVRVAIRHGAGPPAWKLLLVTAWLVVPVGLVIAESTVTPALVDRYMIVCLPPAVILAAVGLTRVRSNELLAWITAGVVLLSGVSDAAWYTGFPKEGWRESVAYITSRAQPGDGIVLGPAYTRPAFAYYLQQSPRGLLDLVPVYPTDPWTTSDVVDFPPLETSSQSVPNALSRFRRVWLVVSGSHSESRPDVPDIRRWLNVHDAIADAQYYPDIHIVLYQTTAQG